MDTIFAIITKLSRILNTAFMWAAGLLLVGMVVLACSNMVLRAVWIPVKGTFELMGFGGALLAALALGSTQQCQGHISVGLLYNRFSASVRKVLTLATHLASLLFFGLACWQSMELGRSLQEFGELSETLQLSYFPLVFIVAIGFAGQCLTLSAQILGLFYKKGNKV